jgi:OmcA/MtrC family decaheme c-type cytochrome
MTLESDPEWTAGGGASRLAITLGWTTDDYANEGSGSSPAPAQPPSFNALDVGGVVTALGGGIYRLVIDLPSGAFDTTTVSIEGHPAADLDGDGTYTDRIAVRNVFEHVNVEQRGPLVPRRQVVDIAKCNDCHDSAGAGISLHGNNRTSEMQVCVVCHNADATDIRQRPADPSTTPDGKREEAIDMKRMVHQIHAGKQLQDGVVVYGFGGQPHDYSSVGFTGNLANCETCHLVDSYSTDDASMTLATTIDTGEEVTTPSDDLNISPIASVCASCHDDTVAVEHMLLNGASFKALDKNIH